MECKQCNRPFQPEDWAASMSGSIMGDEHTDTYYLCPGCHLYTVESCWDNFTGVETTTVSGPFPRAEGDEAVEVIRKCSRPWDKTCRCPAHLAHFGATLD